MNDFVTEGTFVQVNGVPIPALTWVPGVLEPNTADGIYRCVVSFPVWDLLFMIAIGYYLLPVNGMKLFHVEILTKTLSLHSFNFI
jgi:hypothetical protein